MNTQYLFNNSYFEDIEAENPDHKKHALEINKKLQDMTYKPTNQEIYAGEDFQRFELVTEYPGLLLGLGNPHLLASLDSGIEIDQDIKNGFYMDYVTGLPVITGTTVKGVLRSLFKKPGKDASKEAEENYNERIEYLRSEISELCDIELTEEEVRVLEEEIFVTGNCDKDSKGNIIRYSDKDVFLDAIPVKGDSENRIFDIDFITPHKMKDSEAEEWKKKGYKDRKELDAVADPNPLRILKVRPGVTYLFRFKLTDSKSVAAFTKEKKARFFKMLFTTFGIGAKTDVGFGVMTETENKVNKPYYVLNSAMDNLESKIENRHDSYHSGNIRNSAGHSKKIRNGKRIVNATVMKMTKSGGIKIDVDGKEGMISSKKTNGRIFTVGDSLKVSYSSTQTYDDGNTTVFYSIEE